MKQPHIVIGAHKILLIYLDFGLAYLSDLCSTQVGVVA
jgi:hypothetical protein